MTSTRKELVNYKNVDQFSLRITPFRGQKVVHFVCGLLILVKIKIARLSANLTTARSDWPKGSCVGDASEDYSTETKTANDKITTSLILRN